MKELRHRPENYHNPIELNYLNANFCVETYHLIEKDDSLGVKIFKHSDRDEYALRVEHDTLRSFIGFTDKNELYQFIGTLI